MVANVKSIGLFGLNSYMVEVETDVSGYYVVNYSFTDTEFDTGTGSARLYVVVEEGKGA